MSRLFCIAAILFLCVNCFAQDNDRFINYGVNEGLPQSTIYDITQDKDGFIWIGTAGGLARFDGYQFRTYRMSVHDPKAISSYKEFRFYNDSSGRLWIIHFNGISIYNSLTDNFTNILTYAPRNVVIAENHFYGEDKDYIWIGLCSYGIVKIDKRTLQVLNTPLTKTSFRPSNNVGYHGFLEKDKLWIVDNNESAHPVFSVYDIQKQKTDTLPLALTSIVNLNDSEALGIDSRSVFLIRKKTLTYQSIPVLPGRIQHNSINIARRSGTEAVLSSAMYGLFYVHTSPLRISRHISISNPDNKQALYARCVFEDRSGNTWIGTRGDGVEKMSYPYKNFRSYRAGTTRNNVFGIHADDDDLYIGGQAQGLMIFSRSRNTIRNSIVNKSLPQALNNAYTMAGLGKDKLIIIATSSENNGHNIPLVYSKVTGKTKPMNREVQDLFARYWGRGNQRNFLFREASGKYLTNAGEYLVSILPCANDSFCPEIIHHFPGENIASGFTDSRNTRWVGTFTGVFKEYSAGRWQRVHLPKNKEVKSISEDTDGNMWFGTNDEIFVVDRSLRTIHHYIEDRELVNGHVYSIRRDKAGNMWFSHNKGLSVYRRQTKKFEHFDQADGLQSSEFNVGASFMSEDGEMFFGGINGVTAFYPHEITSNPYTPSAKITGIKIFDDPLKSDTAYWNIRRIDLPYTENSISFEFTLPEYTQQAKNRYQFRMSSIDDKWINAGDRRFTRYAGLRPGQYLFEVRGANNDGIWGPAASVEVNIIPPFWQQTWFYILVIAAFILASVGIGIFIQKIRQRKAIRALELQHKIQLERERISRDLHDNVGTQLSLISKNLEGVIDPHTPVTDIDRMQHLQNISQTSKEVIFTLRETIWALNREEISLEELFDKLKSFAQKLSGGNNRCQLEFNEDPDNEKIMLSPSEAIHLFRICQEAIANSMKYANADRLSITISAPGGGYRIAISDNGVGFDPASKKAGAHYGLDNMRYRSEEIQCAFHIKSAPGAGTHITIQKL